MALTPEDVRNKQFSTAKRKGYEMDEVDAFLDQVELEIGGLLRENADLKGRLAAAEQAAMTRSARPGAKGRLGGVPGSPGGAPPPPLPPPPVAPSSTTPTVATPAATHSARARRSPST